MDARPWIAVLIVLGFGFTATNSVLAYRAAKRRLERVGRRLVAPTGDTDEPKAGHGRARTEQEVSDLVLHALRGTRLNLLLAGFGLLVSAAASVWSLYP